MDKDAFAYKKSFLILIVFLFCLTPFISIAGHSDEYEPDNNRQDANPIILHDQRPIPKDSDYQWFQLHNFYNANDVDWIKFYGIQKNYYTISVKEPGLKCDPVIEIYDLDGQTLLKRADDYFIGEEEYAEFRCEKDGIYYAKISQCHINEPYCNAEYGEDTNYKLSLTMPIGSGEALINFIVKPKTLGDIQIVTNEGNEIKARTDGFFHTTHEVPAEFSYTVTSEGYKTYKGKIDLEETVQSSYTEEITLTPLSSSSWITISGRVLFNDISLCAMVLANGEMMFTCEENLGNYEMMVPLNSNGQITLYSFCEGLAPFKKILTPEEAADYDIKMSKDDGSPEMDLSVQTSLKTDSSGRVEIRGKAAFDGNPLNMMVLANGQYMFTLPENGEIEIKDVPVDQDGEITFYGFCEGFKPYKKVIKIR